MTITRPLPDLSTAKVKRRRRAAPPALPRAKPGDLLTADFVNRLIDEVEALGARVAALEAK